MAAEHPILPRFDAHPHTAGSRPGFVYFNLTDSKMYFDNGLQWAELGDPLQPQVRRFDFTAAQVKLWGTANQEILPSVAGFVYRPDLAILYKMAGDAFTLGSITQVQIRGVASSPITLVALNVASVMDQTTEAAFASAPGFTLIITPADAARLGGKALSVGTQNNTDFAGTGSDVTILLRYTLYPANAAGLAILPVAP